MRTPQHNDPGIEQHMCGERDGNWYDNPCYSFGSWTIGHTDGRTDGDAGAAAPRLKLLGMLHAIKL
jgi:hypothetical protein